MAEFVLEDTAGSSDFTPIPDGEILMAEVVNCEVRDSIFDDESPGALPGQKKPEVSFRFRILDEEFLGRTLFGSTSTIFSNHSDCKLRMWVQEFLGEDTLPVGYKFDTDTLIGLPCRVVVSQRMSKDAHGNTKYNNRVQDVFRMSSSSAPLAHEIF